MRLTRSITMTSEGSSPLQVAVTTGTTDPDARPSPLPIQISQGSDEDPQTIYLTWEQWGHVCRLVDTHAPVRDAHTGCGFQWQLDGGPMLECCLAEEHVGAGTHRAVTGESYLEPPHGF